MAYKTLSDLPPELLLEIAYALKDDVTSIAKFSRLCRATYRVIPAYLYEAHQAGLVGIDRSYPDAWYHAVQQNIVSTARRVLDAGMDVNNYRGQVPMVTPIIHGHLDIVKLLLERGADVNMIAKAGGWQTALEAAVNMNNFEAVDLLLHHGAILGPIRGRTTPIMTCCFSYRANEEMFEYLLGKGADIDMKDHKGWSPLVQAVREGDASRIEWLLERGADLHQKAESIRQPRGMVSLLAITSTLSRPSVEVISTLKRFGLEE